MGLEVRQALLCVCRKADGASCAAWRTSNAAPTSAAVPVACAQQLNKWGARVSQALSAGLSQSGLSTWDCDELSAGHASCKADLPQLWADDAPATLSHHGAKSFLPVKLLSISACCPAVMCSPMGICVPEASNRPCSRQQGSLGGARLDLGSPVAGRQFSGCRVGDGDCGTTLRKGAEVILSDLTSRWSCQCMVTMRLWLCTATRGTLVSP